jgi:Ion channel
MASWWRPGSRVQRLHASHSYRAVLVLIVLTYVVIVSTPSGAIVRGVLVAMESLTLGVALWTSGLGWRRAAVFLAAPVVIVAAVEIAVGGTSAQGVDALLGVVLVGVTMVVIAMGVFDQGEINRQSVTGAICIYLFLGILFSYVYGAEAAIGSGQFFAQGTDGTPATRIYFSYVTLTTTGYGDYTPAAQPGRSFAILEELLGQLYLVTVVALLVGRFGQQRHERA